MVGSLRAFTRTYTMEQNAWRRSAAAAMFSVLSPEQRVPADHPLRTIRMLVDPVMLELSAKFDAL